MGEEKMGGRNRLILRTLKRQNIWIGVCCIFTLLLSLSFYYRSVANETPTPLLFLPLEHPHFYSPPWPEFTPINLDSKEIIWDIIYPTDESYITDKGEDKIEDILDEPAGWTAADLEFKRTKTEKSLDIIKSLDILFLLAPNEMVRMLCEESGYEESGYATAGCAGHLTYSTVPCYVPISEGYLELPFFTKLINHEVGHCLGLPHKDNNPYGYLMSSWDDTLHPNPHEIELIKKKLEKEGG